jgi:acylphosphatase
MVRKRVRLVVHGHVQGVFFRDSMRQEAERRGLGGHVRNEPAGTVEAVLEGEPADVDAVVAWAHDGPRHARVERVEATEEPPEGVSAFAVR